MDSDCLIKLVKASLKEMVCDHFTVMVPPLVIKEVVHDSKGQPDAAVVRANLEKELIRVSDAAQKAAKGEDAVYAVFQSGKYDAICSGDKRFIKRLRLLDVPYMTPGVLIVMLLKMGKISLQQAVEKLESLSPMISDDESATVKMFLENWRQE